MAILSKITKNNIFCQIWSITATANAGEKYLGTIFPILKIKIDFSNYIYDHSNL